MNPYPIHPGLDNLVETLLNAGRTREGGASWENCGAWSRRFNDTRLSGTTTAEVCTSLLSAHGYVSGDLQKQIDERVRQVMPWLLERTSSRYMGSDSHGENNLHNFVRPLEAYASYVRIHGRIKDDEPYVKEIADKFLAYEQKQGTIYCFRMGMMEPENDDISWKTLVDSDHKKWKMNKQFHDEYLASCWLAYTAYVALKQLNDSGVRSDYSTTRPIADRKRDNAERFSRLIRKGCKENHTDSFVYQLFLYAQSSVNSEILDSVKEICNDSQIMKEVLSAETMAANASKDYRVPFLPLFVSSLRQFGDLDDVEVWTPLYKAAHFLLHKRVRLLNRKYVVTNNTGQKAREVYTWAHSLRTIAECGVNFYEVKNIIELKDNIDNTEKELEDTKNCLSERQTKLEDTKNCLSETKDGLQKFREENDFMLIQRDKWQIAIGKRPALGVLGLLSLLIILTKFL